MDSIPIEVPVSPAKASLSLKTVAEKVYSFFSFKNNTVFLISDVATALNIPKRRFYDVLNIMQPLGIVERAGRGKYIWKGTMKPILGNSAPASPSEKSHVKDLSSRFLEFVRDNGQNIISMSDICGSVFEDKKGQLRRMYDISAVFEVLNLVKRQPKTSNFLVLPQLRNLFAQKMLPPKKRGLPATINAPHIKQILISPPPNLADFQNSPAVQKSNAWLGATALHKPIP